MLMRIRLIKVCCLLLDAAVSGVSATDTVANVHGTETFSRDTFRLPEETNENDMSLLHGAHHQVSHSLGTATSANKIR